MTKHYMKELSESPVYINGFPFRFDVLETSDPTMITELDSCVSRQVGGIIAISKEQYDEEVKKKANGTNSRGNSKLRHSRQELAAMSLGAQARAVDLVANPANRTGVFAAKQQQGSWSAGPVNHPMPDPIDVPSPADFAVKLPPTMRMKDMV